MNDFSVFTVRLCLTLLHSLWQATAILVVVAVIVRLTRRRAGVGYAAWMSGLAAVVVCMPVTFLWISPEIPQPQPRVFDPAKASAPAWTPAGHTATDMTSRVGRTAIADQQRIDSSAITQTTESVPVATSDAVPSGTYVLSQWFGLRDWKLSMTPRSFEVSDLEDEEETPLNLGEIELVTQ